MDIEISARTMVGLLLRQAQRRGDQVFVRHHDGASWQGVTWRAFADRVLAVAARLVQEGVATGDRVVVMSENCVEWLVADFSIQAAGATTVPIYPTSSAAVARDILTGSGSVLAFVAGSEGAERLASVRTVRFDTDFDAWQAGPPDAAAREEVDRRCRNLSPEDVATIVYTSGTTGQPKGAILAHRCITDIVSSCLDAFEVGPEDRALSFLPYAHVLERIDSVAICVAGGATLWISRGRDQLLEDLQDCRPTLLVAVPRFLEKVQQGVLARVREERPLRRRLLHWAVACGRRRVRGQTSPGYPLAERLVLAPLRTRLAGGALRYLVVGGAPLGEDVEEFFWALGIQVFQGWGMTETSAAATANRVGKHRFGTVGAALTGVEIEIAADGEILVRSPGNLLGYLGDVAATAETLVDGWIHTGDMGSLDADGFLRITDRKRDLIKTAGGKFVAPQPIEARLEQDPLIERAVVIGDRRPYVIALIVPDWSAVRHDLGVDGEPPELCGDSRVREAVQAVVDRVNAELGSWETVKRFQLLPEDFEERSGELTPTLKVRRPVVQARFAAEIGTLYGDTAIRQTGA
ncbi:MAG: long-chain fatty acid--CoA ligase [Candidatus Dormibacteraeota bacterium]|nr:long-chain fatty acid--CoA ligase [Candidatus Dormibacteraeota bacterium]MBO0761292.1 long-chain fatty acid--CoA ligase [Candidatus Dormibacteraeota bacterium]